CPRRHQWQGPPLKRRPSGSNCRLRHFFGLCLLWHAPQELLNVPTVLVTPSTSFLPTASSIAFTFDRYFSVCSFQLFSSPSGGLFLPRSFAAASQVLLFSAAESQSLPFANLGIAVRAAFWHIMQALISCGFFSSALAPAK